MIYRIEQIRKKLQDRNISAISRETGVNRQTLQSIKSGEQMTPSYPVMEKLSDYFLAQESA